MMPKLKKVVSIIIITGVFSTLHSCIISRTARPILTGYVYDSYNNQPIDSCLIGNVVTNSAGYYELEEKRYREFVMPGTEAPPIMINEIVEKEGYESNIIEGFSKYGGASRKGAHWKMDTVFLKRKK